MKRFALLMLLLALCCTAALAQTVPDDVIRDALLENDPLSAYPTCEMMIAWHQVLGEKVSGSHVTVYAAADTVAFGEVNGVFLGQSDTVAPVILTFAQENGGWTLVACERLDEDCDLEDYLPESACEAYDDFDEDEAKEAIYQAACAWLKAAGRRLEVAVTYYDMEEDLEDVDLPEDVWSLTVGWPTGYLDQLAVCRYPRGGRMVRCTTAWEPDEEDDELGLLTYTMTDDATGEVIESICFTITEDMVEISMLDADGERSYTCVREDGAIVDYTMDETGSCGIDVTVFEQNLRIAMMDGIEAYN